jgi:hypothetical protein
MVGELADRATLILQTLQELAGGITRFRVVVFDLDVSTQVFERLRIDALGDEYGMLHAQGIVS